MESFEQLLQNTINNDNNDIISAKVISEVCNINNKSCVLVDAKKKKDFMIYSEEFGDNIPLKDSYIDIIITNNNLEPYGLASYTKASQIKKNSEINNILKSNNAFKAIVKNKTKFGYEITLTEDVKEFQNFKCIYLTKREHKTGDEVSIKVKNISNNTIYFQYNNGLVSYTSMFSIGQVVKCKVQAIINLVLSVDIIDQNDKSLLQNDAVSCIIPFTDSTLQPTDNIADIYKIGDTFDAQIIALSPLRVVLSITNDNDKNIFNLLQYITKGQIIDAQITAINTNIVLLETMINNNNIKCEMPTSEMAWSVIQRESMKNDVWIIGNKIKVQIINFDMRNGRLQVSYKYNLPNPVFIFKNEINPATNAQWKVNDIITAKPTFSAALNNNKQFCYLNYHNVDLILYDWLDDAPSVEKINKNEAVEVVITAISEEQYGLKILVSYPNTPKRHFQELLSQFEYKATYKCQVLQLPSRSNRIYVLKPLARIQNNEEIAINLDNINLSNNYFVLSFMDIPTSMQIRENDNIICKLIYFDHERKQLKFSVNAYNYDKSKQVEDAHRVQNTFSIGNN